MNRDSRFDILRLLSMYMIICGHFIYHGIRHVTSGEIPDVGFEESTMGMVNYGLLQLVGYLVNIGSNLFVMISGYFLIKPRPFSYALKKGFKLWYTIVLYNILIYAVLLTLSTGTGWNTFSLPAEGWSWAEAFTPIYSSSYWFMTMYMGILILSPFLSRMAQALSKREYQILLLVLLIMNFGQEQLGYGKVYSSNILLYSLVFLVGGYVSLHKPQGWWVKYTCGGYFVVCLLLAAASVAKQLFLHPTSCPQIHGLAYNSIPLFTSVCFFLWVANINNVKSKISNFAIKTGPYILAVYLIHENKLIRPLLWDKIIRPTDHIGDWYLVPYMFAVSLAILLLCIAIDYLRALCFAKIGSIVKKKFIK